MAVFTNTPSWSCCIVQGGAVGLKCGRVMFVPTLAGALGSVDVYVMTSMNISGRLDGNEFKGVAAMTVEAQIAEIKTNMPETYAAIKEKAQAFGNDVYWWVRQGLRGYPDFFYAEEGRRVIGTPFNRGDVMSELSRWHREHGDFNIVFFADEGVF